MCRTCAGFYVYRGRHGEINDIFLKLRKYRPRLCCGDGSVGWLIVLSIVLLLIQALERDGPHGLAAGWLAGLSGKRPVIQ